VCLSAALSADTRIQFKTIEGSGAKMETVLIGGGRIRMDMDTTTSLLVVPADGAMIIVDHSKKTVMRITRADMEQIGKMMGDMMKQMEDAMAKMPPEVKAKMAASGMGMPGSGPAPVTAATTEKSTVAGRACQIYRTTLNGQTTAEYCMADPATIDMAPADRQTFNAAMAMMKDITSTLAKGPMAQMMAGANPFHNGMVPLRTTMITGTTKQVSEFVSSTVVTHPAGTFDIPAGYKEEKLPFPGRGRGGL
jgi:hypothetical protein